MADLPDHLVASRAPKPTGIPPRSAGATREIRRIRGYKSRLRAAINASDDGAYAQVDLTTARALLDIVEKAAGLLEERT